MLLSVRGQLLRLALPTLIPSFTKDIGLDSKNTISLDVKTNDSGVESPKGSGTQVTLT